MIRLLRLLLRVNAWNAASRSRIAARVTATTVWTTATVARWLKVVATVVMPKAAGITSAMTVLAG